MALEERYQAGKGVRGLLARLRGMAVERRDAHLSFW